MNKPQRRLSSSSLYNPTDVLIQKLPFNTHGYIFQEVIGRGSFSVVFKVIHTSTNEIFAAKALILFEENNINDQLYEAEINSLKLLDHPNIIKLYAYFKKYRHFFMILQLCEGGSLKNIISSQMNLHPDVLNQLLIKIIEAVNYCHSKNIAHRDIKPDNIFINFDFNPILGDFGFSLTMSNELLKINSVRGSFSYIAPETLNNNSYCFI